MPMLPSLMLPIPPSTISPSADSAAATSDAELIARCRDQDADAFDRLITRYREALARHIAGIVRGDTAGTEDVLQDVFLRVWLRADSWDGRGPVKAWLFRIAANTARNHLRGVLRRRETPFRSGEDGDDGEAEGHSMSGAGIDSATLSPDLLVVQSDERRRLHRLMDALSEEKRDVLRLVLEEREVREVADTLGIPEGTVKSRLFHARKQIARSYQESERADRFGDRSAEERGPFC